MLKIVISILEKMPYNKILINLKRSVFTEISNFSLDASAMLSLGQYGKASV